MPLHILELEQTDWSVINRMKDVFKSNDNRNWLSIQDLNSYQHIASYELSFVFQILLFITLNIIKNQSWFFFNVVKGWSCIFSGSVCSFVPGRFKLYNATKEFVIPTRICSMENAADKISHTFSTEKPPLEPIKKILKSDQTWNPYLEIFILLKPYLMINSGTDSPIQK